MFKKNTAVTGFTFGLVSATDGSDITTGTPVGFFTLDGGSQTAINDTSPVHEGNGQWSFDLLAAEMNGDIVGLVFTHSSAITAHFTIRTDTKIVSELNDFDSTADDVAVVTVLTNLPSIPANWLTATGINNGAFTEPKFGADFITSAKIADGAFLAVNFAASSLNGKGDWNIGKSGYALTVADWNVGKTGYSLSQAFPTNFADLSIVVSTGLVDVTQAAADKAWSTTTRQLTALQANIIAASSFAANAIDAAALATTAVDEIADGVVDELLAPHVTVDSLAVHLKDILDDVTGLAGSVMRGTDGANTVVPDVAGVAATPAEVATALTDIHLDHLLAVDYNPATPPGVVTALLNELVESDGGVARFSANTLEQVFGVTLSELGSIPAATPTASQAIMLGYMAIRNKRDTTASSDEIHDSGGSVIATAVVSDDTVIFTKAKYA